LFTEERERKEMYGQSRALVVPWAPRKEKRRKEREGDGREKTT